MMSTNIFEKNAEQFLNVKSSLGTAFVVYERLLRMRRISSKSGLSCNIQTCGLVIFSKLKYLVQVEVLGSATVVFRAGNINFKSKYICCLGHCLMH